MIPTLPPYCYDIPSHHIPMGSSRLSPYCYGLLLLLWLLLQCPWGIPASAPIAMASYSPIAMAPSYCYGCLSSAHGGFPPLPLLLWPPIPLLLWPPPIAIVSFLECPWGIPASAPLAMASSYSSIAMASSYCYGCLSSAHGRFRPLPLLLRPPPVIVVAPLWPPPIPLVLWPPPIAIVPQKCFA